MGSWETNVGENLVHLIINELNDQDQSSGVKNVEQLGSSKVNTDMIESEP